MLGLGGGFRCLGAGGRGCGGGLGLVGWRGLRWLLGGLVG